MVVMAWMQGARLIDVLPPSLPLLCFTPMADCRLKI